MFGLILLIFGMLLSWSVFGLLILVASLVLLIIGLIGMIMLCFKLHSNEEAVTERTMSLSICECL
jgi:hypothetical protein